MYFLVLGALCGLVGFRVGWRLDSPWLLPLAQGILGFVGFLAAWRGAGPLQAVIVVAGWALGSTVVSLVAFGRERDAVDRRVWRARAYRESMLDWLRSGRGPESRPLATLRAHVVELGAYVFAAALTANLGALVLGAALLNYMNAWVAELVARARPGGALTVCLLAWNPWSVVRVAAYVLLGAVCAAPALALLGWDAPPRALRVLLAAAIAGIALDYALKLVLSPWSARRLAAATDLAAPG